MLLSRGSPGTICNYVTKICNGINKHFFLKKDTKYNKLPLSGPSHSVSDNTQLRRRRYPNLSLGRNKADRK